MQNEALTRELNELQEKFNQEIENVKKKYEMPTFEVGSYWEHSTGEICLVFEYGVYTKTIKCKHISSNSKEYAYHYEDTFKRKLTPEEVQEALTKEAVKRGFAKKDKVVSLNSGEKLNLNSGCFAFNISINSAYYNGVLLFYNGIWAEIVKEKTLDELAMEYVSYWGNFNGSDEDAFKQFLTKNKQEVINILNKL